MTDGETVQHQTDTDHTSGLQSVLSEDPVVIAMTVALEKAEAENAAMRGQMRALTELWERRGAHRMDVLDPIGDAFMDCVWELRKVIGDE